MGKKLKTKLDELSYLERKALERYYELKSSRRHEVLAGLIKQSDLCNVDLRAIEKELTSRTREGEENDRA